MSDPIDPIEIALIVVRALDALGIPSTIGGSIASSIAGEPRSTVDIDIIAAVEERHAAPLVAALETAFYVDEESLRRAARERRSTNLVHQPTQIKVDLFVAGGTPLDAQQLARRRNVEIDGRTLYVHPPEDILLQKLRWFRLGNETSDRQWRDVLGIVRVQGTNLDRAYLWEHAPTLGVADLLARALGEGTEQR